MSASIKVARAGTAGRAMPGTGYRGDPGLFGFLGKVAKGAFNIGSSFIPGGSLVRTAVKTATSVLGRKSGKVQSYKMPATRGPVRPGAGFAGGVMQAVQGVGTLKDPSFRDRIRTAGQAIWPGGVEPGMMTPEIGSPSGYHVNKSSYWLKSGEFIPKGTRWVRNRRRNPLNPRALDRAMGRIGSAKKAASKLGRITIRKKCD